MTTVVLADGKLELSGSVRWQLGLQDGDTLELEITDHAILLRPVDYLSAWEEELVRRARADFAAGRFKQMTEEELDRLIDEA